MTAREIRSLAAALLEDMKTEEEEKCNATDVNTSAGKRGEAVMLQSAQTRRAQ